jgi:hypothetical protein
MIEGSLSRRYTKVYQLVQESQQEEVIGRETAVSRRARDPSSKYLDQSSRLTAHNILLQVTKIQQLAVHGPFFVALARDRLGTYLKLSAAMARQRGQGSAEAKAVGASSLEPAISSDCGGLCGHFR